MCRFICAISCRNYEVNLFLRDSLSSTPRPFLPQPAMFFPENFHLFKGPVTLLYLATER